MHLDSNSQRKAGVLELPQMKPWAWGQCAASNANVCELKAVLWPALLQGNRLLIFRDVEMKRETLPLLGHSSL